MTCNTNQGDLHFWMEQPGVERRVSVVVGGDGREDVVPGTGLTLLELEHRQAEGRRLQARAVRVGFASFGRWLAASAKALIAGYRRYRDTRRAVRELSELPEYLLRDLGVSRGEIRRVAAWGRDYQPSAAVSASADQSTGTESAAPAANDSESREAA